MIADTKIIALDDSTGLARSVAQQLGKELIIPSWQHFADGEMRVVLEKPELFADKTVIIVQSTSAPVHEHVLGIAFLAHELRNAQARRIVGVIPYFGYARQEESNIPGKPGPAAVIAQVLQTSSIDVIVTVALHTQKIKDLFSIPLHDITLYNVIAQHIREHVPTPNSLCLVAPDEGAKERIAAIAQQLNAEYIVFKKERYAVDKTRIVGQTGSCSGKVAVIIDDMIDTGGTALQVVQKLVEQGMQTIYGYFVHGVFSGNTIERVQQSALEKVFVSNTIALPTNKATEKIDVFDVSSQLVTAIDQLV